METTKTSVAIAKRMRDAGYDHQSITQYSNGSYNVSAIKWGDTGCDMIWLQAKGPSPEECYESIERQWKKEQVDG